MQTAAEIAASNSTEQSRPVPPGIDRFRKNPFRVLRAPVSISSEEAVWRAENLLARVRAGVEPKTPDPVPMLPKVDALEIQRAAQNIEEPLQRLVEQTLWFDFETDPRGKELETALQKNDLAACDAYMAAAEPAVGSREPTTEDLVPLIAHRLNQANVRVLLAFATLHEQLGTAPRALSSKSKSALKLERGRASDAHLSLDAAESADAGARWRKLLTEGIQRWAKLLADPQLSTRILHQVEQLGDELVSEADVATLVDAIRSALTDLVVGEMKHAMMHGYPDRVRALASIASASGLEAKHWGVALRPLRNLFRSEIEELSEILGPGPDIAVADARMYLTQLGSLAERWGEIDEGGALGLDALIDEAVLKALERVRQTRHVGRPPPEFEDLLTQMREVARSRSLQERVDTFITTTRNYGEGMCHFCQQRPPSLDHCAALTAKVETGREHHFNRTVVHYRIGGQPVARCEQCAKLHSTLRLLGQIVFWAILVCGGLIIGLTPPREPAAVIMLAMVLLGGAWGLSIAAMRIASGMGKDADDRHYHDWNQSVGAQRMRENGMYSMRFEMATDGWSNVEKAGVQSAHDRGMLRFGCMLGAGVVVGVLLLLMR